MPTCNCGYQISIVEGDLVEWECSAKYAGMWEPTIAWEGPGGKKIIDEYKHVNFTSEPNVKAGVVHSVIRWRATPQHNGASFVVRLFWNRPENTTSVRNIRACLAFTGCVKCLLTKLFTTSHALRTGTQCRSSNMSKAQNRHC